ncbi:accessory gene regulator ArgB-like protein [Desulfoscipio gibsoniae]|uniref:Protein possibly involved in post-translational modification of quorum-sensing peptides n=1 Tax=Desulfoscipio gibsoniae DSM 7213 TaxID=767817 RepID=R4KHB2_9FIRM|nr:accessory gene regulator B family protein [Desulfoscipio gibsoniae]AGL01022.1 protein possibly involved in post-translational modification of quorum-sensing peptides [Desulfoscipio gibsoniae DSM 7213]
MNLNQLAGRIANYLSKELALDTNKIDTLRFGFEIIFAALIKGFILISLAYLLGILPEVVFAMVCGAIYRLLSGGAHCNGYWRCLTLGVLSYLGAGELGIYLGRYLSIDLLVYLLLTGYLLFSLCVIALVPGEVPYKKITSISERNKFKILSLVYLSSWLGISIIVVHYVNSSLALAGFIAVMIQTISFSPPGYKIIHQLDNLLVGLAKLFIERRYLTNEADR